MPRNLLNLSNWFSPTTEDIIIASKIRLSRNLQGFDYMVKIAPKAAKELQIKLKNFFKNKKFEGISELVYYDWVEIGSACRNFLMEKQLVSEFFPAVEKPAALILTPEENISIMVGEIEHLVIQTYGSGIELKKLWQQASTIDDAIEQEMPYAFHEQFGYLASCPTNLGTGLRASVFMFLPALTLAGKLEAIEGDLFMEDLMLRKLFVQPEQQGMSFYQIANNGALGYTEEEILIKLQLAVEKIAESERLARRKLWQQKSEIIADKAAKAFGVLQYAMLLTYEDALSMLVDLRLASDLKMNGYISLALNAKLMLNISDAALELASTKVENKDTLYYKRLRADLMRTSLEQQFAKEY